MSVYKKDTTVATYPGWNVVTREPDSKGFINLTNRDGLISSNHLSRYTVSSAVSYALEYNDCPIEAYTRCIELGHKTHWINANATSITSEKQEKKTFLEVDFNALYRFEGQIFTIVKAPNNNLNLQAVKVE